MKKTAIILCFLFLTLISYSQHKNTSYFDKNGKLTYVETALYYRVNTDTSNYFQSFYSKTKHKYFEGKILNAIDTLDLNNKYSGLCMWYYANGKIKNKSEYNDFGLLHGVTETYTEDGYLEKRIKYTNGKINQKKYLEFDKKGHEIDLYDEDFLDNDLNWNLSSEGTMQSKIKIGGLNLSNLSKSDYTLFSNYKIDSANYQIITTINSNYVTPECKTGIIYGFKDSKNYNYFFVSKFRYHVGLVENGVVSKKIENYFSDDIKGNSTNELNITVINDSVYFYINNSLQNYCYYKATKEETKIGFYITNGNALFDNLIIKQYAQKVLNPYSDTQTLFNTFNEQRVPLKQIYSGITIGKNGYIATALKNVPQINEIIIELVLNDSIVQQRADIFIDNNFTILKLRDSTFKLPEIVYNSYTYNQLVDNKFVIYNYEKDISKNTYSLSQTEGNAKFINEHKHNLYPQIKNKHYCEGAPVFDLKGGLLGVISNIDEKNSIKTFLTRSILYPLQSLPNTNELKPKANFSVSDFEKDIRKNIVVVKVF